MGERNYKSAAITGPDPIELASKNFREIPEPKIQNGKLSCPVCNETFEFLTTYHKHACEIHKVGTSASTVVY